MLSIHRASVLLAALAVIAIASPLPATPAEAGTADPLAACQARGYADFDAFPSVGVAALSLNVPGPLASLLAIGPIIIDLDMGTADTVVCRGLPQPPGCRDDCTVETEIIQLELAGHHPLLGDIRIGVDERIPSKGAVVGASIDPLDNIWGGLSFFDVFVTFELTNPGLGPLRGGSCLDPNQPGTMFCLPFHVEADLTDVMLPPVHDVSYNHPFGESVPLWVDPDPSDPEGEFIIGQLLGGCHKPYEALAGDEHHLCLLAFGAVTPDGSGDDCLEDNVLLVAADASAQDHDVLTVTATPTGPLVVTPFVPSIVGGAVVHAALAVTNVEQCTDVGVTAVALYTDGHSAPAASGAWRQHA